MEDKYSGWSDATPFHTDAPQEIKDEPEVQQPKFLPSVTYLLRWRGERLVEVSSRDIKDAEEDRDSYRKAWREAQGILESAIDGRRKVLALHGAGGWPSQGRFCKECKKPTPCPTEIALGFPVNLRESEPAEW